MIKTTNDPAVPRVAGARPLGAALDELNSRGPQQLRDRVIHAQRRAAEEHWIGDQQSAWAWNYCAQILMRFYREELSDASRASRP